MRQTSHFRSFNKSLMRIGITNPLLPTQKQFKSQGLSLMLAKHLLYPLLSASLLLVGCQSLTAGDANNNSILFSDNFDRKVIGENWYENREKAHYSIKDGVLHGVQFDPSKTSTLKTDTDFTNAIIEFDFRFKSAKLFKLVIDDKNATDISKNGHVAILTFYRNGIEIQDAITGYYNLDIRKLPLNDRVDKMRGTLEHGEFHGVESKNWNKARVEIKGDVLRAYVNNELVVSLNSPGIAHSTKTTIGLNTNRSTMMFDNFTIR